MNEDVKCPHKDGCTSYPNSCKYCKNNTGKKDYFEPTKKDHFKPIPWYPAPWEPYAPAPLPNNPIFWCDNTRRLV